MNHKPVYLPLEPAFFFFLHKKQGAGNPLFLYGGNPLAG